MLWHETVVGGGGVGPRDLDLYGDGGAGGRTLPGGFLGGPGDHLIKTVGSARVRAELENISCPIRSGQVVDWLKEGIYLYLIGNVI